MIDRDMLRELGWNDDLIAAVLRQGDAINRDLPPLQSPVIASMERATVAGTGIQSSRTGVQTTSVLLWHGASQRR